MSAAGRQGAQFSGQIVEAGVGFLGQGVAQDFQDLRSS